MDSSFYGMENVQYLVCLNERYSLWPLFIWVCLEKPQTYLYLDIQVQIEDSSYYQEVNLVDTGQSH